MKNNTLIQENGFIAIIATIIISLILSVMALQESTAGFRARFNILGTEAKEQAIALAEGCAKRATANIITDFNYVGNSTTTFPIGTCHVFQIIFDSPSAGFATIKTQAHVRGSYANLILMINLHNINVGHPTAHYPSIYSNPKVTTVSLKEIPILY